MVEIENVDILDAVIRFVLNVLLIESVPASVSVATVKELLKLAAPLTFRVFKVVVPVTLTVANVAVPLVVKVATFAVVAVKVFIYAVPAPSKLVLTLLI